jgi:hypothetical protein
MGEKQCLKKSFKKDLHCNEPSVSKYFQPLHSSKLIWIAQERYSKRKMFVELKNKYFKMMCNYSNMTCH